MDTSADFHITFWWNGPQAKTIFSFSWWNLSRYFYCGNHCAQHCSRIVINVLVLTAILGSLKIMNIYVKGMIWNQIITVFSPLPQWYNNRCYFGKCDKMQIMYIYVGYTNYMDSKIETFQSLVYVVFIFFQFFLCIVHSLIAFWV